LKKNRFRIVLTLLFIFLAFYFLYPTYKETKFSEEIANLKTAEDSLRFFEKFGTEVLSAREKRIKLGLDLQGGMYVIMEVDVAKLLQDLAKRKDDVFNLVLGESIEQAKIADEGLIDVFDSRLRARGLSLKAYFGEIRDDEAKIKSDLQSEVDNAIDRAIEVVRNRIDQYGVSEPVIQKKGGNRLVVELPGVSNAEDVRKLLQGTALLEFQLVYEPELAFKVYQKIDAFLAGGNLDSLMAIDSLSKITKLDTLKKDTTSVTSSTKKGQKKEITQKDTVKKTDTALVSQDTALSPEDTTQQLTEEEFKVKHPWFYIARIDETGRSAELYVTEANKLKVQKILERKEIKELIPPDIEFVWSNKSFVSQGQNIFVLYALKRDPELTGGVIVNARSTIDQSNNQPIVTMEMNSEGAADWARITGANIGKRIAIVLDNVVYSAPVVKSKITGGNSQIEGMANIQEARLLEIVLKAGALPAPLKIIEERTVGPSLGEDSIKKGLYSSVIALLLVALFMVIYYHFAGGVADLALLFNMLFVLGIMASFKATLTLPGIAGLILTIGMSVDSNVLIYERIREELASGKPMRTSIEIGYKKAFSAIIDSHLTSIITGIILYQFGTGPIQGFALTLIIGLLANLFTAIVITRIIFDILTEKGKTQINFG